MRRAAPMLALVAVGCAPNPRNEIAAIADAALTEARTTASPGFAPCVQRTVAPWRPAAEAGRVDPPAPPGFEELLGAGVFRGGGGLKGSATGGVPVAARADCLELRGPLVSGDCAMIEAHTRGQGWNTWLRRVDGDWRVAMTTTSLYPREARSAGADR